jgi:hypothetical protein
MARVYCSEVCRLRHRAGDVVTEPVTVMLAGEVLREETWETYARQARLCRSCRAPLPVPGALPAQCKGQLELPPDDLAASAA